ncbi:MAG: hypothetical protein LBP73_03025, partial [Clostridiales Family XIII bacterium]|nr:hypothetical protein [Clostridiales Family XIII bacterium]
AALAYFAGRGLAVEFKTPLGVLRLDRTAAADIAEQGGGDQCRLRFRRAGAQELNLAQQSTLRTGDAVYELAAYVGGQKLGGFDGALIAAVPYSGALPAGAWRLDESGKREAVQSSNANGVLRFTAGRFSFFAVGRGAWPPADANTPWYYVR